jgi:Family of unknown function (DUF6498)
VGFLAALLYALLMNGIPLAAVVYTGGSPAVLLLLYWFETVLMVVTGAIRIVLHRRATAKAGHFVASTTSSSKDASVASVRAALGRENDFLKGFLSITVIFTIAHGVFVLLLVFLFKIAGPVSWEDARWALNYAIFVQGLFLLWDLPRLRAWSFAQLGRSVGQVQIRVLVTQLGLIFGLAAAGMTGSPWGLVGTFVVMRALADACMAGLQGFMKRRDLPPGMARALAKRSKQSVESLEAEFDAVKRDGAQVEALLERPVAELRR